MIGVAVFTDEAIGAVGLASVLAAEEDFQLLGVWDNQADFAHLSGRVTPDLLLLDMATGVGVPQVEWVRRCMPSCRVVCWARSLPFEMAIHLLEAGVKGIVPKSATGHLLCSYLRRVTNGEQCIDQSVFVPVPAQSLRLTGREQQILALVSLGMKNREMASALSISEGTLKVYVSRLLQKTGMRDRHQLALYKLKSQEALEMLPEPNGKSAAGHLSAH
jgi:two-component system nitrate/nitrite response regulator NarL